MANVQNICNLIGREEYGNCRIVHSTSILYSLRKKCPYSELFWSVFSRIRTCISPYSVRMRENADQNNSEYGHFPRSDSLTKKQQHLNSAERKNANLLINGN